MTRKELLDEFLSEAAEVHSFVHGLYAGLTEWRGMELPDDPDIQKEPHYFKAAYLFATAVRWIVIAVFGSKIIG